MGEGLKEFCMECDNNMKKLYFPEKQKELSILIGSDKDNSIYKRFCIVPCNWNKEVIFSYLIKSLKISEKLLTLAEDQIVFVFQNSIVDFEISSHDLIDYYWHDVKEFIVEVSDDYFLFNLTVITGHVYEEVDIQNFFMNYFPNKKIIVNYYRDSWLNRLSELDL